MVLIFMGMQDSMEIRSMLTLIHNSAIYQIIQTLSDFDRQFGTDEQCRAFLAKMRWPNGVRCDVQPVVEASIWKRYAFSVPRKKSKPQKVISEKTRASDERLRRELEQADPETFKRLVRPLSRSSKTESNA
jgi:hypothetical protein